MKKFLLILCGIILLSGCACKSNEFKESYEALNGKENASGKIHRTISIDEDNPFEKVDAEEIVKKIENNETFYVYFGDELCPWCRSVIEKFIEVAKKNKIDKVYYVKIWDKDGNEILRDKYTLNDKDELELSFGGTEAYKKLLTYFDSFLSDYNLTDSKGNKVSCNEKRIYAPNFVYVKDGKTVKLVEGISSLQTDARGELTKEILDEEESIFEEFFKK